MTWFRDSADAQAHRKIFDEEQRAHYDKLTQRREERKLERKKASKARNRANAKRAKRKQGSFDLEQPLAAKKAKVFRRMQHGIPLKGNVRPRDQDRYRGAYYTFEEVCKALGYTYASYGLRAIREGTFPLPAKRLEGLVNRTGKSARLRVRRDYWQGFAQAVNSGNRPFVRLAIARRLKIPASMLTLPEKLGR